MKFSDMADILNESDLSKELAAEIKNNDGSMTRSQFIDLAVSKGMKKTTAGAMWQRNKKHLGTGEGSSRMGRSKREGGNLNIQKSHRTIRDEVRAMMKDLM